MSKLDLPAMKLTRTCSDIRVEPPINGLDILNACAVLPASNDTGGMMRRTTRPLFPLCRTIAGTPYAVAPRYQELLVRQLLASTGVVLKVSGPEPCVWAVSPRYATVFEDRRVVEAVGRHERFTVAYRARSVGPAYVMAQVLWAYRDKTAAVFVKSLAEADEIVDVLKEARLDPILVTRDTPEIEECPSLVTRETSESDKRSRVVVCTYCGTARDEVDLVHRDLVFVADAVDGLEERGRRALSLVGAARVVGFRRDHERLSPPEVGELLETYGPVEVHVPGHGLTTRPVTFGFVPVYGKQMPVGDNPVELKAAGVWNNDVRNRRFVRLATALADGDGATVASLLPSSLTAVVPDRPCRVLVIAYDEGHGNNLIDRLPTGWAVCGTGLHRREPNAPGAGFGEPAWERRSTICAFDGVKALRLGEFDVVFRMDGGTGVLPLRADALDADPRASPLVLIDCDDQLHPDLARAARQRQQGYREAGWHRVGDPHGFDELERYLDRHPLGCEYRALLDDVARNVRSVIAPAQQHSSRRRRRRKRRIRFS